MQKKNVLTRAISALLALVMVLGMVPMGALEVYATQTELTWHEITASPAQTIYKRIPLSEFGSYVTTSDKAVPVYIGFGDTAFYALNNSGTTLKENTTTTDGVTSTSYSVDSTFSTVAVSVTALSADGYYSLSGIENCSEYYIYSFTNSSYGFSNSPSYTGTDLDSDEIFWLGMNIWWSGAIHFQPTTWLSENKIELTAGNSAGAVKMWAEIDTDGNASISKGTVVTAGVDANGTLCDHYTSGSTEIVDTEYTNMYVYVAEEIPATASYAALQTKSYTVTQGEDSDALLLTIRSENSILVNATASETGATSYPLTTDSIGDYTVSVDSSSLNTSAAGTYALPVALSDGTNTVSLGSISVTVTAPASPYAVTVGEVAALDIDGTATASATVTNNGETVSSGYTLAWSSDDTAVATVDASSGVITAVAPGTATITATVTIDGTTVTGTTQVTVNVPSVSISFANTAASVEVGKTVTLTPTVTVKAGETVLENVSYTLAWESSSTGNATVSGGTVTGVAEGSANITATVETITVGGVTVTLDSKPSAAVAVTVEASKEPALTLNKTETTLSVQTQETITATVTNSSETTITWESSDESVATVDDGVITAVAPGTATITATLQDVVDSDNKPVTATVTVTVTAPVVLSITPDTLTMGAGSDSTLTNSITHNSAALSDYTATITWTSDNTSVATVDSTGKVTAVAGGTATITATLTNLKDSSGNAINLTDAGSVCVDTVTVTVIQATVTAPDSISLQITEETANPTYSFELQFSLIPDGTPSNGVDFTVGTISDSAVASVSMDADKNVTVTGLKVGTATFTVTATVTLSDNTTISAKKTVSVRVISDAVQQDQAPDAVGKEESTYVYELLDAAGLSGSVGKNLVISFDEAGNNILIVSDGALALTNTTITKQTDGKYTIVNGNQYSVWKNTYDTWENVVIRLYDQDWYNVSVKDNTVVAQKNDYNTYWIPSDVAGGGVVLALRTSNPIVSLCLAENGEVICAEATSGEVSSSTVYIFSETEVEGAQLYAALYCKDYSYPITAYSADLLDRILAECYVATGTAPNLSGETTNYPLNALPEGYRYEIKTEDQWGNTVTTDSVNATGDYTITVYGKNTSGSEVSLGSFTVTIEEPASITLTVETDGTLNASGNLSLGTGKTANVTASVTVTLADGTVVPAEMLAKDITIADSQNYGVITFENGVVTGAIQGSEALTATLNSLSVNGLDILSLVTTKTATLTVNVFQVNYVNLDTSKLSGYVTLDVEDAPSAEMDLAYVTDPANQALPTGVSVSYECEVTADYGTGVEATVQDGKLVISGAENKGTAEVTVRLILTEDPDNAAWETGTVIEKTIHVTVTHNAAEPYEITVTPSDVLLGVGHTKSLQAKVTQGTNTITSPTITWTSGNTAIATVDGNGTVTGVAIGETTVTATVTYTVNEEIKTATFQVPVKVAAVEELYTLSVEPEKIDACVSSVIELESVLNYEGGLYDGTITWEYSTNNASVATVDENGTVTLVSGGSAAVTVKATFTGSDGDEYTKTVSVPVRANSPTIDIGTDYAGIYYGTVTTTDEEGNSTTKTEGTQFTITPHVDLLTLSDDLTSYKIKWTVSTEGIIKVTNGLSETEWITCGGPLTADENGIQYIGDAKVALEAVGTGTVELTATIVELNGQEVNIPSEPISITVNQTNKELAAGVFYDAYVDPTTKNLNTTKMENTLYDIGDLCEKLSTGEYELRIKDLHTFQKDSNGLDARVIAVVGDNHIDFSNVVLNVYDKTTGQLVLDEGTMLPVEIPAGMLTYYDVETANVGWVPVRVTFKDYCLEDYDNADTGDDLYEYAEYPTGGNGQDGIVWMYVRGQESEVSVGNAVIGGTLSYIKTDMFAVGQKYTLIGENDYMLCPGDGGYYVAQATVDNGVLTAINGDSTIKNWYELRFAAADGGYHIVFISPNTQATTRYLGLDSTSEENALLVQPVWNEDGTVYLKVGEQYLSLANKTIQLSDTPYAFGLYQKVVTGGTPVTVTVTVDNIRPWIGAADTLADSSTEATAQLNPMTTADENYDTWIHWTVQVFDTNGTEIYKTTHKEFSANAQIMRYSYDLEGAITNQNNGLVIKGKDSVATGDREMALGFYSFLVESIPDLSGIELTNVVDLTLPIIVRQDSVQIDNKVTYAVALDEAWGGTDGYNYISWMGAGPVKDKYFLSSYAITYECDLPENRYDVGVRVGSSFGFTSRGVWHEEFRVNAPLGTSSVSPYLHSITRLNGTVLILDEGERQGGPDYTISVEPQLLILEAANSADISGVEKTGTVQATIRDKNGKLITVEAKVKWTMRNSTYATSDFVTTYGMDQSNTETVPASQTGITTSHTITGQNVGVTYYTAHLIEIQEYNESGQLVWTNVAKHNIADYAIIYVINQGQMGQKSVVVDYDKPISIDIHDFIEQEHDRTGENYEFLGFSDLEHALRKDALTEYGSIAIDGEKAIYTQSQIMENVDPVYVIFQYVTENNTYYWHHYLLNIIPASVMYYETDGTVASEFTLVGDWGSKDIANSTTEAENYDPAVQDDYEQDSPTHDEVYGYDSSYDYDAYLSNQSSLFVNGMSTASGVVAGNPETSASFTFTGTGFDIIARTNMDQATLRVHVYDGSGTKVKTVSVICKGTNELYQIPVIAVKDLKHGTYTVEIIVYGSYTAPDGYDFLSRGDEFYFDAIRIYDPVKGNATAEAAYAADGEYDKTITQIGKLLVDQKTFQNTAIAGTEGTGAVFMDSYTLSTGDSITGSGTNGYYTTTDVGTYQEVGPNNEVYLGKGQGIAFILRSTDAIPASIQVGAKSITGDSVTLNAKIISKSDSNSSVSIDPKAISTSSAMYYVLASEAQIKSLFGTNGEVYVVIWNTGETVLSVTDIKVSYGEEKIGTTEYLYSDDLAEAASVAISGGSGYQLEKTDDVWYYCDANGNVVASYTGLAATEKTGTWYVINGKVDFSYSGLLSIGTDTYYIRGGCVDDTLNGIAERDGQWLYFTEGKVDTSFTGIASYGSTGNWYVLNGVVQTQYTGLVTVTEDEVETKWYVVDGKVQSDYTGTVTLDGVEYAIENGKVVTETNS